MYSDGDIERMYAKNLKAVDRIPEALAAAMGNTLFLANFKTKEEMNMFYKNVLLTKDI